MRYQCTILLILASLTALAADETTKSAEGETHVRVAAISFVPVKFDLDGNAQRLEDRFRQAKQGGAQIAVAPEGALEGYVVNEIIAGKYPPEKMREVAISLDAPVIRKFQDLARELEMCLVFGLAERIGEEVFNCAVFIDRDGEIRGKYHKMQLAEGYDDAWWFNRLGTSSRAFDTSLGRCGILICNDRWNPQLARIPALDGAQFLVIPSYGSRSETQDQAVLSRSQENGIPIIEANVGVTLITNGQAIAGLDRQEEGITFANIVIPAAKPRDIEERDTLERQFLDWREIEMPSRYENAQRKRKQKE